MPNLCANRMKVSGPAQFVDQFVVDCFSGADGLDFDKIIPMPKVLDGTSTGMSDAMGSDAEIGIEVLTRKPLRSPLGREESILDRELARKAVLKDHDDLEAWVCRERPRALEMGHKCLRAVQETGYWFAGDWRVDKWGTNWIEHSSSSIERKRRSTSRLPHHGRPPTRCITRWRAAIQRSKFGSRRSRKEMNSHTSSRQVAGWSGSSIQI